MALYRAGEAKRKGERAINGNNELVKQSHEQSVLFSLHYAELCAVVYILRGGDGVVIKQTTNNAINASYLHFFSSRSRLFDKRPD